MLPETFSFSFLFHQILLVLDEEAVFHMLS